MGSRNLTNNYHLIDNNSDDSIANDSIANLNGQNPFNDQYEFGRSNTATPNPNQADEYTFTNLPAYNQYQMPHSSANSNDDLLRPQGLDRYPNNSSTNSRIVSMASSINDSQSATTPYLSNDFSPFGGYPANSFPLTINEVEADDYLHNPNPIDDADYDKNRFIHDLKNMDKHSAGGLFGFVLLFVGAIMVFIVFPALTFTGVTSPGKPESYEILTKYHYPMLGAIRTELVDPDTPTDVRTKTSRNGDTWNLVFSDEFNAEGRTFYDGDDQFWTAPDIHYAATKDLEWYDPDASTTSKGTLNLKMDAFKNHDLFYRSGMVQSWNKMCFTQGRIEMSARLPNYGNISGLWPGMWTMGNLGRPGYLGSTDGVWPYTYESCDAGITANQSSPDGISYLPGQRLNSCTCPGEPHPNRGTGRGAPEIDVLEGEIHGVNGRVSQSYQVAPYDIWYIPDYDWLEIHNLSVTIMNTYAGGPLQQAVSAVTMLNTSWYEFGDTEHNFQNYGYEYLNDNKNGYLTWFVGEDPTLTIHAQALHPNGNINWRRISKEPMSIILNLGISNNWAYIDWASLHFPVTLRIDYVRLYQPSKGASLGCDPPGYPTNNYIDTHKNLYYNPNITIFTDGGYTMPKHSLGGC